MRSTTFDMLAMALMAIAILLTVGVGITWAYLRESRGDRHAATRDGTRGR